MQIYYEATSKKNKLILKYIKIQLLEMGLKGHVEIDRTTDEILEYLRSIKNSEYNSTNTQILSFLYDLESRLNLEPKEFHLTVLHRMHFIASNITMTEKKGTFQFIFNYDSIAFEMKKILERYITIYTSIIGKSQKQFLPANFIYYLTLFDEKQIDKIIHQYMISDKSKYEKKLGLLTIEKDLKSIWKEYNNLIYSDDDVWTVMQGETISSSDFYSVQMYDLHELLIKINVFIGYLDLKLSVKCSERDFLTFMVSAFQDMISTENLNKFIHDNFTFNDTSERVQIKYSLEHLDSFNGKMLVAIFRLLKQESIITSTNTQIRDWIYFNFLDKNIKGLSKSNIWDYLVREKHSEITKPYRKDFSWIFNKPLV